MLRLRSLTLLCASAAVLAGCGQFKLFETRCAKAEDFASVEDNAPLKIPAGLQGPDARNAVPIPALAEPERPIGPESPCLDAPPKFSVPKETRPSA
jgi:hypothetical protein